MSLLICIFVYLFVQLACLFKKRNPSRLRQLYSLFVYLIGLHAVQFENNWMKTIPRTAKSDEAVGRVQFGNQRNLIFSSFYIASKIRVNMANV